MPEATLMRGPVATWFAKRGWIVVWLTAARLIQATKRGHITHSVQLEPGETPQQALERLKVHMLEVYPGGCRECH